MSSASNPSQADPALLRRERAAASVGDPLALALLALTFTTGIADAVSYLGLGRVFSANMTGNVVLLGFGIAGSGGLPVLALVVSLGSFLLGAGTGGLLGSKLGNRHVAHVSAALTLEALLIAAATVLAAAIHVHAGSASGDVVIGALALAMGIQTATARRLAVPDLSTTVLTQTLTGLAADSRLFGGSGKGTTRRGSAVAAMLAGAVTGALLLKVSVVLGLATACALVVLIQIAYLPAARR
jgi:uncharacterized membrane protein YoaK (UPF0700 family)